MSGVPGHSMWAMSRSAEGVVWAGLDRHAGVPALGDDDGHGAAGERPASRVGELASK
jgi:hypothetical protein